MILYSSLITIMLWDHLLNVFFMQSIVCGLSSHWVLWKHSFPLWVIHMQFCQFCQQFIMWCCQTLIKTDPSCFPPLLTFFLLACFSDNTTKTLFLGLGIYFSLVNELYSPPPHTYMCISNTISNFQYVLSICMEFKRLCVSVL